MLPGNEANCPFLDTEDDVKTGRILRTPTTLSYEDHRGMQVDWNNPQGVLAKLLN
jgi:hypothetical protein